jgi:N4-gp56 family major capsid protein
MATTSFAVNDALCVKLWSKMLDSEALKSTDILPLIGDDTNSIIQRKTELSKGPGDQVTFGLRMQLSGAGFTENETAEGNGEELTRYTDALLVNELGHVVGVKSENTIDAQRVPFDLREEARDGLAEWWSTRLSVSFFNQVCGYTAESRTKFTGLQAAIAPSSTRIIRQSSAASDQALTSNDKFSIDLIDKAKEMAITATPKIRPVRINGADKYVVYLHDYQVTDMRTSVSTGQWLDIQKAAMAGMESSKSPIYSGALGEYNGVIIRQANHVTQGVNSSTGAAISTVRRAVLLGAQAAVCGYGQKNSPGKYRWNEELLDHKRRLEVSAWSIWGLKKTVYNSTDFGTVVISTYAAAHT